MSKDRVVHYRAKYISDDHGTEAHEPIACSARLPLRNVEWTEDVQDVSCNNCQRTKAYRDAKE